jgi:predicted phosphoribosyltransferase
LKLPLDVAVVSKITPPWNSEVGYGAVAFDGSVRLNEATRHGMGLGDAEVRRGIEETLAKVRRRVQRLHGSCDLHAVADRAAILVDDGLASGFTMRVAIEAVRKAGATDIVVAVPTGSLRAVEDLAPQVEELYCANVRAGSSFAVADAYEHWTDVEEHEASAILSQFKGG